MKIYNNYDVGVHASSCENFPNIVIEMLSQGLPIITSDIPVMREILGNDYIFFNWDNLNNIVKKISDFLQNRKYFNYLNNRKKIFRDRYNLDNQQKNIFNLFNEKNI